MKKISRLVVTVAAVVMLVGSTLTASAATSTATVNATASDVSAVSATADGITVTVAAMPETKVVEAQQAAVSLLGQTTAGLQIEKCFNLQATISGPTNITMNVPGITAGQKVAVLHQKTDGTWENLTVVSVSLNSVTAVFNGLSPVAIVTYASPKTGEHFPIAGIVCIIALFGAAICYKKFAKN